MAEQDILSALLSSASAGGEAGASDGYDPGGIGALKAYQGSPFLQGQPSHAGPLGQISQAIMPIIAAKIYEKQAEAKHREDAVGHLVDIFKLANAIDDRKLKQLELKAKSDPSGQLKQLLEVVKSVRQESGDKGGDLGDMKISTKVGDSTVSFGGAPKADTLFGLIGAETAGDTTATPKLERYAQLQGQAATSRAEAGIAPALEIARGKQAIEAEKKAKPPDKMIEGLSAVATNISELDRVLAKAADKTIDRTAALTSSVTGGLLSDPTIRDYNAVLNNISRIQAGTAQTSTELQRLAKGAPSPLLYFKNPDQFATEVRAMRNRMHRALATEARHFGDRYDVSEVQADVDRLAPTGDAASATPVLPGWKIDVQP